MKAYMEKTDVELKRDILEELEWEPSIEAARIGVTTSHGVATLTGHVPTYAERHAAEEATKRVHGVKGVANEIEVRPVDSHLRDDEHIAAAAVRALEWDTKVPSDRLQVTVGKGWITLEGTVDRRFQKTAADHAVRHLKGVRGVINRIQVQPGIAGSARPRLGAQVKAAIEAALRRSAVIDSERITVELNESTVVLTGNVHSQMERDEVERIAWTAHEVSNVENCITVTPWGQGPTDEWGY